MHICHILEANVGGTRTHLYDLVRGLADAGVRQTVIVSLRRDLSAATDLKDFSAWGVDTHVIEMVRAIRPRADFRAYRKIVRILKAARPNLVHTHSAKAGVLGRLAARSLGVPAVVHTPHVFPFEMRVPAWRRLLYRVIERRAGAWADRIICVSHAERDAALAAQIAPAEKLTTIHNGVSSAPLASREEARAALGLSSDVPVIGCVGRLSTQKGQDLLLAALPALVKRYPSLFCVFAGDGEEAGALKHLAARKGVADRCLWLGATMDVHQVYAALDVFVQPSRWEGLPYALLEAMQVQVPVVATRVGGMPEAIETGVSGVLVSPENIPALTEAIGEVLGDANASIRMGAAAAERVQSAFRRDIMLNATRAVYDAVLPDLMSRT